MYLLNKFFGKKLQASFPPSFAKGLCDALSGIVNGSVKSLDVEFSLDNEPKKTTLDLQTLHNLLELTPFYHNYQLDKKTWKIRVDNTYIIFNKEDIVSLFSVIECAAAGEVPGSLEGDILVKWA